MAFEQRLEPGGKQSQSSGIWGLLQSVLRGISEDWASGERSEVEGAGMEAPIAETANRLSAVKRRLVGFMMAEYN